MEFCQAEFSKGELRPNFLKRWGVVKYKRGPFQNSKYQPKGTCIGDISQGPKKHAKFF